LSPGVRNRVRKFVPGTYYDALAVTVITGYFSAGPGRIATGFSCHEL